MSTRAEIGRSPIAFSRLRSQAGLGPLRTPRMIRPTNSGQAFSSPAGKSRRIAGPGAPITRHGVKSRVRQPAEAGGREIAGDAGDAEAVAAVGRQLDLDHRTFEAERLGRRRADLGCRPAAR